MHSKLRILFVSLTIAISNNFAEADGKSFAIVAPRPMTEAVTILGEQLNCVITYEDPIFQNISELRETYPGSGDFVPTGGEISYTYESGKTNSDIILGLINKYNEEGNAGKFTLIETGKIYNVLPVRYRNREGQMTNYSSPLDTKITLSLKETNCFDAINKLCSILSQSTNEFRIQFADAPGQIFINTLFSMEFVDEPARNILNSILSVLNTKNIVSNRLLTWQLRFDPQNNKPDVPYTYFLCFHALLPVNGNFMRLRVDEQRPIAVAAKILEKRFGKIITYEDPPYICKCDIIGDSNVSGLAGGIIDISWGPSDSVDNVLQSLTETPISPRPNPDVFKFFKRGNKYDICPHMSKDEQGNLIVRKSIMDSNISLNASNVDGLNIIQSICSSLSDSTREKVVLGTIPESIATPLRNKVSPSVSISSQKGNVSLDGFLKETNDNISWQLLFAPASKQYELVLHEVKAKSSP